MPFNFNFQPIYQRYVGDNAELVDKLLTRKEEQSLVDKITAKVKKEKAAEEERIKHNIPLTYENK